MQISNVYDMVGCGEGEGGDSAPEYQAANELFELMTKNTQFDKSDDHSLSAQDLVLLYQNIDIGTRLINDATQAKIKKPNQYVETIVYNDDNGSNSDCSEICTPNDIHDVFMLNQERIDFLNDKSLENSVCSKYGNYQMHTSNLTFDYDKSFLFQDAYITDHLQNMNMTSGSNEYDRLFSTSLFDYICCKRLDDNNNLYMDNIIRYAQHTIEQLKRISNGEYLTDRAKEKWMKVKSTTLDQVDNNKVLATSTSIPLHVECKVNGSFTWDDIVRSEVDVRSLSKILVKKIVVEIPKLICGSGRLFNKPCTDNLVISCQRGGRQKIEKEDSRVDVVLQLQRSETGGKMSNISSITVLKTTPALPDIRAKEILSLQYIKEFESSIQNIEKHDVKEPAITVIQLIRDPEPNSAANTIIQEIQEIDNDDRDSQNEDSCGGTNDYPISDRLASFASIQYSSESSLAVRDVFDKLACSIDKVEKKPYNLITPDELHMTMRKLTMQNSVLNETNEDAMSQSTSKRRSPVRMRIKSPYENKSFLMEDKKRKRLLEIRARREKRKIAMSERSKITKNKFGKGTIMPQASSSVTKLSITNKSFYNSIYGQNPSTDNKAKSRKFLKGTPDVSLTIGETQEDYFESSLLTPDKNSKKYINRSYYLDDAETEMMYMQMKKNESKDLQNPCSASDSIVSNEFNASLEILQELMSPSDTNFTDDTIYLSGGKLHGLSDNISTSGGNQLFPIAESVTPLNTTVMIQQTIKKGSSDECRKSIDQLYDLINQFGKSNTPVDPETSKVKLATSNNVTEAQFTQDSDNTTNAKHISLSNTENVGKNNIANLNLKINKAQLAGTPKVTITSKVRTPKTEPDKMKKDRNEKRQAVISSTFKGPLPDNPLKAISQLLHEFDNVKKNRQKPLTEEKSPKKVENVANDVKTNSRQGSYRRKSRIDQHLKDNEQETKKVAPYNTNFRDMRVKPMTPMALARTPHKQDSVGDENLDKYPKKKLVDIIDEAKEARGEAVRGPSKNHSRLISLSQPKKSYVQAHHEEYQTRYGRNVLADRLQKLATTPPSATILEKRVMSPATSNKNRCKRSYPETGAASLKLRAPSVPQLDQRKAGTTMRKRRSASSSPETVTRLVPTGHKHTPPTEAPDTMYKMASAESDGHDHCRPLPSRAEVLAAGLRCRVPILPRHIELVSPISDQEDSRSIGCMLPRIGQMPGKTMPALPVGHLTALPESVESRTVIDSSRSESDYCVDVLEDRHLTTAVSALQAESLSSDGYNPNSAAEIEQLETALCSHITGTFQKRLRIKNLTLTPKPSMQQVFLLQSGDAGSMLVQSLSSHKLKKTNEESLHELKTMPVLSKSHLDWTFTQFPVQIATVGFAFPEHRQNAVVKSNAIDMSLATTSKNTVQRSCQANQCLPESFPKPVTDSGVQADVVTHFMTEFVTMSVSGVDKCSTSLQMLETKPIKIDETNQYVSSVTMDEVECINEKDAIESSEEANSFHREEMKKDSEVQVSTCSPMISAPAPTLETVSYTTSLDMLVGLLTEIQKITCQNQMITSNHENSSDVEISGEVTTIKKLENTTCDLRSISMSSLENLRQIESNTSIYTYNLSNLEGSVHSLEPLLELRRNSKFTENSVDIQPENSCIFKEHVAVGASKPTLIDKEVSTNLYEADWRSDRYQYTSVSSYIDSNPVTCSQNELVPALPSTHSTLTVYHTPHTSVTRIPHCKKLTELPKNKTKKQYQPFLRDKTDLNNKHITLSICGIRDIKEEDLFARNELTCSVTNINLDPLFKIKRDILVSMYSILVLTVFAALSFPELLKYQS